MTDFREKTEIFNSLFVKHCSLINIDSPLSSELQNKTDNSTCKIFYRRHIKGNKQFRFK